MEHTSSVSIHSEGHMHSAKENYNIITATQVIKHTVTL